MHVHKKLIAACLRNGKKSEFREFDTLTLSIKEMANRLIENECHMAAMESTGVYWKSIYNILELIEISVIVVSVHHMKNVPGRKTDEKYTAWIADLLIRGLLKLAFI